MLTFLIVASIMAAASYGDCKAVMKTNQKRLQVFYTVALGLSFILAALHCLGITPDDILSRFLMKGAIIWKAR